MNFPGGILQYNVIKLSFPAIYKITIQKGNKATYELLSNHHHSSLDDICVVCIVVDSNNLLAFLFGIFNFWSIEEGAVGSSVFIYGYQRQ